MILGKYFHFLFYFFLIGYLLWLYFRFSFCHVFICFIACLIVAMMPHQFNKIESFEIQGTVKKVSEKYCYIESQVGYIKLYHDKKLEYNDLIQGKIEYLGMNKASNDHAFDEELYLYSQNVFLKARLVELYEVTHQPSLYHFIQRQFSSNNDIQSYQRLLLLGEKDDDIQDDYQQLSQLSLVHLFALSGMHIHVLYTLLFSTFGLLLKKKYAKIMTYCVIGFYILSIPMQISLWRAFLTLLLYDLFKNYLNQLDILSFLIWISLLYNPYIIYNISFIFSYFIYFIVLLTKTYKYSFFWIYLSTIPLVMNMNYQIPIASLLVGSFLVPFIEIFYILCCLSLFFSFGEVMLSIGVYILKIILKFLDVLQLFCLFSKPSFLFIVMYYLIYFYILYKIALQKNIHRELCMLLSLLLSFSFYSENKIYGEITMIDVGQGDCTLIRLPMNQGNILIDTGGNKNYDLATTTIIPYLKSIGVHKLDYVYISHDDFDHCGALESLVNNFPVSHVIKDYEAYRQIGCMEVKMLEHTHYSDSNDQSLIMYVHLPKLHILFTGDASTQVEKELKDKYPNLDVDILKVSHHGSDTASSVQLFEWINPKVAMIGVKKNNMYHHPSYHVIQRLDRKNINILRTDEDGMFHIRFYPYQKYMIYR